MFRANRSHGWDTHTSHHHLTSRPHPPKAAQITNTEARVRAYRHLLTFVTQQRYEFVELMVDLFVAIAGQSKVNKMNPKNLGTVFGTWAPAACWL